MRLYARFGDAGGYEDFDDVTGLRLAVIEHGILPHGLKRDSQFGLQCPGFTGQNYISCYWGTDLETAVKSLTAAELSFLRTGVPLTARGGKPGVAPPLCGGYRFIRQETVTTSHRIEVPAGRTLLSSVMTCSVGPMSHVLTKECDVSLTTEDTSTQVLHLVRGPDGWDVMTARLSTGPCEVCATCRTAYGVAADEPWPEDCLDEGAISKRGCDLCGASEQQLLFDAHLESFPDKELLHIMLCDVCLQAVNELNGDS